MHIQRSPKFRARSKKKKVRLAKITAAQFRETRRAASFDREEAAAFLGVSVRTIGHWETGRARPSYAAFRLLRIYRNGDLIDPAWADFRLIRGKLVTPENHTFAPHELVWQSLLVRRAREFGNLLREREAAADERRRQRSEEAAAHGRQGHPGDAPAIDTAYGAGAPCAYPDPIAQGGGEVRQAGLGGERSSQGNSTARQSLSTACDQPATFGLPPAVTQVVGSDSTVCRARQGQANPEVLFRCLTPQLRPKKGESSRQAEAVPA